MNDFVPHHLTSAQPCTWRYDIEEIFKFIHPHFGQTPVVLVDDLARASRETVRGGFTENVAHVGTGHYFQGATTLPDLQMGKNKKTQC